MNGVHDMGGMQDFGPVVPESEEPVFHADWERRIFALTMAMGAWGRWNLDTTRFVRESMPPVEYLASSYYERWLYGLEHLLVERGFLDPEDLARVLEASETAPEPAPPVSIRDGALRPDQVGPMLSNPRFARRDDAVEPKFKVGDAVVARTINPLGHTRLPRYVRGRRGEVVSDYGVFVFPDAHAHGQGSQPQHVYSVRFNARELWGPQAQPRDSVYVDLWDDYLDPA
jgi:nitrile hydratase